MNKHIFVCMAAGGIAALTLPIQARQIDKGIYRLCVNDIFTDQNNLSVKKIVTDIFSDGSYSAEDLGEWLLEKDLCKVQVLQDLENYEKITFYEIDASKLKKQEREGETELFPEGLVFKGDVLRYNETMIETVLWVNVDGSFYTVQEMVSDFYRQ